MNDRPLPVTLFWHMHQPPYRDALSGRYVLPWTYLHAIKDYTDMAWHLEAQPGAKAVVNFTPVLIGQIEDLDRSVRACLMEGVPLPDALLATLSNAPLPADPAGRLLILRACLRADRENLIGRFPPLARLADLATAVNTPELVQYVSDQMLYDLSVWYHIAWLGESVRREDPRVAALEARERGFDAADRLSLLQLIGELLAGVLPRFRKLSESGRCELAVLPYSHPILPLLLDFATAQEGEPAMPGPRHARYPGGEERVAWHLQQAVQFHERVFGRAPRGCWPSEGAISEPAIRAIEAAGFDWLATSVAVLRPSLALSNMPVPEDNAAAETQLNRAFRIPGSDLSCFFRQDAISDLIGFTYSGWHGDDAAANFVRELERTEEITRGEPGRSLLVALDGENAWEYYPYNGFYFLRALYKALVDHPRLKLMTLSEVVDDKRAAGIEPAGLPRVRAGSWVYGMLSTWMGAADKNAGWDLLCEAKLAFDAAVAGGHLTDSELYRAREQLAACEASDWFWWFGDYNPAAAVRDFDELFRHQLASLYRSLHMEPPATLEHSISAGHGTPKSGGVMRRCMIERVLARRRAGVLLPVLPALLQPGGGALGDPARRFIDWLSTAGFSIWQVLPLVPVDHSGSPYWARSDRAGNPAFLDGDAHDPGTEGDFEDFRATARWLRDYALFEALAVEQQGQPWWRWPSPLRNRDPDALARAEQRLAPTIDALAREQWRFDAQWRALRIHAAARNVRIFGDLPIYVAPDSVATWTAREQFLLRDNGEVAEVAGVPPDYFSADGQLWGNPLYDWERQRRDGFAFWLQRLSLQADRFDLLRIDHFRALAAFWAVPAGATTAREGQWRKAPGHELLQCVTRELPQLEMVAEDLGVITPDVTALRHSFAMPGMRVMQFGFDGDPANPHLPHQHEVDSVIYTGTHDNDTTRGWYESLTPFARDLVRRYLGRSDADVVDALRRSALASVGKLAVLPIQDLLDLGSGARLNRPGTVSGNWSWRLPQEALTQALAMRYRDLNQLYNRGM